MKITAIKVQKRDNNRVNISVDGKYKFSLDTYQLVELGIRIGKDYDESEILALEHESQFGKLYARALEYCLMRPHSAKEVKDYLYRKTKPVKKSTGETKPGFSSSVTTRVFERLVEKGYIDDEKFTEYWIKNRSLKKGISWRKLIAELVSKGVSRVIIDEILITNTRDDSSEILKIIEKKRARYPDEQKFIAYLARQGFDYDLIKKSLSEG